MKFLCPEEERAKRREWLREDELIDKSE